MRFHDPLTILLTGRSVIRALRALVRLEGREFTGRELASAAGLSHSQAQSALARFEDHGIVRRRVVGKAYAWTVEANHVLYQTLKDLTREESDYLSLLEKDIVASLQNGPAQRVILFGSVAAGRERPSSDIDLWVEVPLEDDKEAVREQLFHLGERIFERYGNPLAPIVHSQGEVRALAGGSLLREIEAKGHVLLPGAKA